MRELINFYNIFFCLNIIILICLNFIIIKNFFRDESFYTFIFKTIGLIIISGLVVLSFVSEYIISSRILICLYIVTWILSGFLYIRDFLKYKNFYSPIFSSIISSILLILLIIAKFK